MQNDVARDFEEEVSDEENAGAQAVDRLAEPQIAQHLQFREADVHPIEKGRDVAGEQQRDQAPGDAGVEAGLCHVRTMDGPLVLLKPRITRDNMSCR